MRKLDKKECMNGTRTQNTDKKGECTMTNQEFELIINEFNTEKDKEGCSLQMDSLIISDGEGNRFKHLFNEQDGLHPVRSICKTVVSMCFGILLAESRTLKDGSVLTLDTLIWPIIKNKVSLKNLDNEKYLNKISLFHLMTHTIGFDTKLLKTKDVVGIDPSTFLDLVCNTPIVYQPGKYFLYSNAAPFLLAVVFQEITGINLAMFAEERIFTPLGIKDYKWRNYGIYCAGATGLDLKSDDLHKIAELVANEGRCGKNQIVPKQWMKDLHKPQVLTPSMYDSSRVFPKYAYGLLMWICGIDANSNYFVDGSDGQYIIIIPKNKLVITTLGHQKDMKPITRCLKSLLK